MALGSIIYIVCAIVNVVIGFGASCRGNNGTHYSWAFTQYDWDVVGGFRKPIRRLFAPVIFVVDHAQASGYFIFRYASRALVQRRKNQNPCHKRCKEVNRTFPSEKETTELENGLHLPLELVIMVAQEVHYADLINLSRSSKRLRAAFFEVEQPAATIKALQQYVCAGDSMTCECGVCGVPTCYVW